MKLKLFFLFLVSTFLVFSVKAGTEIYSNRLEGDQIVALSSGNYNMQLIDPQYFTMDADPNWGIHFTNESVKNYIQLGIKEKKLLTSNFAGTVDVEIRYKVYNGNSTFQTITETKKLSISYSTDGNALIDDKSTYTFQGAHYIDVRIVSIIGLDIDDIYLQVGMNIERYYRFESAPIQNMTTQVLTDNQLEIRWGASPGAESYELEWVHINDYTLFNGQYKSPATLNFNYYLNSTRVEVHNNFYRLPLIFDHGYLIFRVRAVGRKKNNSRVDGQWNEQESGWITSHNPSQIVHITSSYDEGMNWAHQVMYTEGGKRMEAISFMDGLGKAHQNVTSNPETRQIVVSNIYYDEKGRAVVSDLPTPFDSEYLKHYLYFNRAASTTAPYWKDQFDNGTGDVCNPDVKGFNAGFGAGKYYSQNNPKTDGANSVISNEGEFAFQRIQYKDDNTGRVSKVGSAGEKLTLGGGHETQFYYPSPNENELIDLFGIQVGEASHYQRMVTVDPNGQIYVQYTDMAGRVVASYMSGQSPQTLTSLPNNSGNSGVINILSPGGSQFIDLSVPSSTLTYTEFIPNDGDYTLSYGFTPQQYETFCHSTSFCLDCVYDLSIRVIDECQETKYFHTFEINGAALDTLCNGSYGGLTHTLTALEKGEYVFEKKLTVNLESVEEYLCMYLEDNTCLDSYPDEFNAIYSLTDFENCDPSFDPIQTLGECDSYRARMLRDFAPGGQYAAPSSSDALSIFNPNNAGGLTYLFGPSIILEDNNGQDRKNDILNDFSLYSIYYQPSWADQFLNSHPEYCLLEFCELLQPSHDFDQMLRDEYDYFNARTNGYFTPVGDFHPSNVVNSYPTSTSPVAIQDPFFSQSQLGEVYRADMEGIMNVYASVTDPSGTYSLSMWEYAIYQVTGCNSQKNDLPCPLNECNLDAVWAAFREMYLKEKAKFVREAYEDRAANPNICPYTRCIGVNVLTSGCSGNSVNFSNKISHFGNSLIFSGYQNASFNDVQSDLQTSNQAICQIQCEEYADEWLETLDGCNFSGVNMTDLRRDLIAVCMTGCTYNDPNSPLYPNAYSGKGGITTPPGTQSQYGHTSVDDVLTQYLGSGYHNDLCTDLLISNPGKFKSFDEEMNQIMQPMDTCACNEFMESEDRFLSHQLAGTLPSGITTVEQFFYYEKGMAFDDLTQSLCICNESKGSNPFWTNDHNVYLISLNRLLPANLTCAAQNNCIDCSQILQATSELLEIFGPSSSLPFEEFQAYNNFEVIFTNYMNRTFDMDLPFSDFYGFYLGCQGDGTPFCEATKESKEWAKMMNLSAHLGYVHQGASNIDLSVANVVYKYGQLKSTGLGKFFSINGSASSFTVQHTNQNGSSCDIEIELPADFNGELSDIVSFGKIYSSEVPSCQDSYSFVLEAKYYDCGILKTTYLTGTSACFKIENCECGDQGQTLCYDPFATSQANCFDDKLEILYQITKERYETKLDELQNQFRNDYLAKCSEGFATEYFNLSGPFNSYQYTLFYYDQAGNLVRTVAPEGINMLPSSVRQNVIAARNNFPNAPSASPNVVPNHKFQTNYRYNSYNQLVETTNPDQEGATNYFYDRYGRIVLSQNPVQRDAQIFAYSFYDPQGRPVQVGLVVSATGPGSTILEAQDKGLGFRAWVTSKPRSEVTITQYDRPASGIGINIPQKFANGLQENLRLRVASVFYYPVYNSQTNVVTSNYESATHYSYDIHGNVKETIQDVPELIVVNQQTKSTQYEYELISGNVTTIHYQKNKPDAFTHEYKYDKINRLTEVFTSKDGVHKSRQAHYRYYDHGPLARVELGEYKVQGLDYAYTINGWMKGMNSSVLNSGYDIGKDGGSGYLNANSAIHSLVAKDALAYTLGYFKGDFTSIAAPNFEADYQGASESTFSLASANLYNGNIRSMTLSITGLKTIGKSYHYDQLNRLVNMQAYFSDNIASTNSWANGMASQKYLNSYQYDRNGNIINLIRNGSDGGDMDQMSYLYGNNPATQLPSNRLDFVEDAASDNSAYDDIKQGQSTGNYDYDKLGQLTYDRSEGIFNISWRMGDKKLHRLVRDASNTSSSNLEFKYNPMGQRIIKIEKPRSNGVELPPNEWIYTYYTYDAGGNLMGVYKLNPTATSGTSLGRAVLDELHVYGASRLGMRKDGTVLYDGINPIPGPQDVKQNTLGKTYYELSDYLGNVNAVITDRKLPDFSLTSGGLNYDGVNDFTYYQNGAQLNDVVDQITLGAWIKTTQNVPNAYLASYYRATTNKTASLVLKNGKVYLVANTGTTTLYSTPAPANTVNDGTWHHVVATANASSWSVYVDGVLVSQMAHPGGNFAGLGNYSLYTGYNPANAQSHYQGQMKNLGFWKRALNITEINQVISGNVNLTDITLKGYYPMNSPALDATPDQSVYGRHMALLNGLKSTFSNELNFYQAVVVRYADYYPFGMEMHERTSPPNGNDVYRYGYNGMEKDNEVSGEGNSYTTEFRQYDPRLGRWKSLDPLMMKFPWMSPYVAFDNNPIFFVDPYGLESSNPDGGEGGEDENCDGGGNESGSAPTTYDPDGINGAEIRRQAEISKRDHPWEKNNTKKTEAGEQWSDDNFEKRIKIPEVQLMMEVINLAASTEWQKNKSTTLHPKMGEEEKQNQFKTSAINSISILLMEFHTGTGNQVRVFHEDDELTEYVKWSPQTYLMLKELEEKWLNKEIELGQEVQITSNTSPGQTDAQTSFWAHGSQFFFNRPSFYLGGMEFTVWVYRDKIVIKAVNEFTISSGVTKDNGKSNLIRVKGKTCPLGNTKQIFWFTHSLPSGPPKR